MRASVGSPVRRPEVPAVQVVFTTDAGTVAAVLRARELAKGLGLDIRILAPHVVPYPLPLDHPSVDPVFRLSDFRVLADQNRFDALLEIRVCRDWRDGVAEALPPQSLVLIGGRRCWWPTREWRLARALRRAGHDVLFVESDRQCDGVNRLEILTTIRRRAL